MRIDRKRRQPVTVLLKALGWTAEQIRERFGFSETMLATLEKDHTAGQDEALLDIYRKLRPGEPPTKESAQTLLENLFFKDKRYDLAKVGRYKANKKLGLRIDDLGRHADRGGHRHHHRVPGPAARRRDLDDVGADAEGNGGTPCRWRPTTSTTSATAGCAPSAS